MSSPVPKPARRRVLFLSGLQIHPPFSGGHLRSVALAGALKRRGRDVFVYSLAGRRAEYLRRLASDVQVWPEGVEEFVDRGPLGFVAQYGSQILRLPPVWLTAYLRACARWESLLPPLLRQRILWADAVVADFPFVGPVFESRLLGNRLRVLSTHNVEHHLYGAGGGWRQRFSRESVRHVELAAAASCDLLVACSPDDRRFFEATAKVSQAVVVPNGIDVRRFRNVAAYREDARRALGLEDRERVFLFTASRWGPNREAFDYLHAFARREAGLLRGHRVHLLVVGNVVPEPVRFPGFTATGRVDVVEPYFAAADAALNPVLSGAGTNVKMGEFIAVRLPVLTTEFGARGFRIEDGRTGFLFRPEDLAAVLVRVGGLFDAAPERLRELADLAYAENKDVIDMDACVKPLDDALDRCLDDGRERPRAIPL